MGDDFSVKSSHGDLEVVLVERGLRDYVLGFLQLLHECRPGLLLFIGSFLGGFSPEHLCIVHRYTWGEDVRREKRELSRIDSVVLARI